jgi:hypothetical protein
MTQSGHWLSVKNCEVSDLFVKFANLDALNPVELGSLNF